MHRASGVNVNETLPPLKCAVVSNLNHGCYMHLTLEILYCTGVLVSSDGCEVRRCEIRVPLCGCVRPRVP